MDKLPREIIDLILDECLLALCRNAVLNLRLVCRAFNHHLKPLACSNINVDFWRMTDRRPRIEALQTIGYHCQSMFLDFTALRDDMELDFHQTLFRDNPDMVEFCKTLQRQFCMHEGTFTELEFYDTLVDVLFYCRQTQRLRLALPFEMIPGHSDTATMILANTFKALANRPEEESSNLRVLVLDKLPDTALCHMWMNPSDIGNIFNVMVNVENLVIGYRQSQSQPDSVLAFGASLWSVIGSSRRLATLCLIGKERPGRPLQSKWWTDSVDSTPERWRCRSLPLSRFNSAVPWTSLTCLELKQMDVTPAVMIQLGEELGPTLQELYLSDVYLMVDGGLAQGEDREWLNDLALWVGHPFRRPPAHSHWIAMELRSKLKALRICRASFLGYEVYVDRDRDRGLDFDLQDPCGLGRPLGQRFVEVITGCEGPPDKLTGEAVMYLPPSSSDDHLLDETKPRPLRAIGYDTNAYQMMVSNPTSRWLSMGIDELFENKTEASRQSLDYFAKRFSRGIHELRMRLRPEDDGGQRQIHERTEAV